MPLIQCPDCARDISERAPTCPHCGAPVAVAVPVVTAPSGPPPMTGQSGGSALAALCSFFVPGFGQLIQGRPAVAFLWFVVVPASGFLAFLSIATGSLGVFTVAMIGSLALYLWNVQDAATFRRQR